MNHHLSPEQLAKRISGERCARDERHLRDCAECATELAQFESGLSAFRQSVWHWAQREHRPPTSPSPVVFPQNEVATWPRAWVLAAIAFAMAVGMPLYREIQNERDDVLRRPDALLLENVDTQLSRTVPAPMEPLMDLMLEEQDETQ
jgi:hypothetical protein